MILASTSSNNDFGDSKQDFLRYDLAYLLIFLVRRRNDREKNSVKKSKHEKRIVPSA